MILQIYRQKLGPVKSFNQGQNHGVHGQFMLPAKVINAKAAATSAERNFISIPPGLITRPILHKPRYTVTGTSNRQMTGLVNRIET